MPGAENYKTEVHEINGIPLVVTTYKVANKYFCQIANRNPGATIARAQADSLRQAIAAAMSKAESRLM